jgi:RsmE family RNA methyltransferase
MQQQHLQIERTTWHGSCRGWSRRNRQAISALALFCYQKISLSLLFPPLHRPLFDSVRAFPSTRVYAWQHRQRYHCLSPSLLMPFQYLQLTQTRKPLMPLLFSKFSSSTDRSTFTSTDSSVLLSDATRHLPRLYVKTAPHSLIKGVLVPITTAQSHYLLDVMRITNPKRWQGFAHHVRIFNGHDGEWLAKAVVTADSPRPSRRRRKSGQGQDDSVSAGTMLECIECLVSQPSSNNHDNYNVSINLYMGQLKKKQQRKWVMEKVTELGVDEITLLDTEYSSDSGSDPWDHEKHMSHLVEATEQCERLTLPALSLEPKPWDNLVEEMRASTTETGVKTYWLVCRERSVSSAPILSVLQNLLEAHCIGKLNDMLEMKFNILVGPEGGWSPQELDTFANVMAADQLLDIHQIQFVSLGPSVLRAETAAITAVAVLQMYAQLKWTKKR